MERSVLGFDVGGTHLRGARVKAGGGDELQVVARYKSRWRDGEAAPDPLALAQALRAAADELGGLTASIGIGIAAQCTRDGDVIRNAPNLGWRDVPARFLLAGELGLPESSVHIMNDVDAIVEGERRFGVARGHRDIVAAFVGTGVGGAVVADGVLVRGARGFAGEVGHVKIPGVVARCGCGQVGCLEALCGGAAILAAVSEAVDRGELTVDPALGMAAVESLAEQGDAWALAHRDRLSEALVLALSGCVTLLNPSLLLLGGGVLERSPGLFASVAAGVLARSLAVASQGLEVRLATTSDEMGPLGAATVAIQRGRGEHEGTDGLGTSG